MSTNFHHWFETIVPTPSSGSTLLCFPYSGSGVAMFGAWRKLVSPQLGIHAVRLPGRESKLSETPRKELNGLADELAESISQSHDHQQRLVLVGFSLGGLIAYEVARRLQATGVRVPLLVVGATRAPHGKWSRGTLHRLSDDKFLTQLDRQYKAVPPRIFQDAEMRRLLLPMLRSDIEMYETYQYEPGPPLESEILTLVGTQDSIVKPKHVYPWRELAKSFRHRSMEGDHYFVRSHGPMVLKTIEARLRRHAS